MPAPTVPLPPPAHSLPLPPARPAVDGVEVLSGIAYAAPPGIRPLELDFYRPTATVGPIPVVIFVHGGGWWTGSRRVAGPAYARQTPTPFELVARSGVAVASIDYRLSGEAQWPTQLHDAKAAVRWLRSRVDELGIDPNRIAAWGESAGGHLAALLGLTGPDLDGEVGITGPSSAVSAVVAWYPPSDLPDMPADLGRDPADPGTREAQLIGAALSDAPERAAEASPINHIHRDAPPILLLHGRDDQLVPCAQSERFHKALVSAGVAVDFHTYTGANHMWLGSPDAATDALDRTIAYLVARLIG